MNLKQCNALVEKDLEVIAPCQHLSYYPLVVDRVEGAEIVDIDGNRFVDFLSSASSLNLGGGHPVVLAAIRAQLEKCTQYTAAYSYNVPMVEYAQRLASVFPGGGPAKVCFGNCGSDANDAAIKFARAYTGRSKIISFHNAYHGSTYGSASLSTVTTRMRAGMGPFLPEVYHFPYFGVDVTEEDCTKNCLLAMEAAFSSYLPAAEVAAVIIEPMQGDGGLLPAHPIFMERLYQLCRSKGILFIAEEVQQAFFRTGPGNWFGIESYTGIQPDGIILGKSLGAGLTLGAFVGRAELMDSLPAPAHLFTLSGNPLACAAGIAAFDHMRTPTFQAQLAEKCRVLHQHMTALQEEFPQVIGAVKGMGLSYGIEVISQSAGQRRADPVAAYKICYQAYEYGTVLITLCGNILRIQPPLVITPQQLARGFSHIRQGIFDSLSGHIPDTVLSLRQGW